MLLLCLTTFSFLANESYAQTTIGSCSYKLKILEDKITNSRFCKENSDCVEVKYNLDGCSCSSSANKNNYVSSLVFKTDEYYKDCVYKDGDINECNCPPAVKHECIWGRCTSIRCGFNKEYQLNECECPVGSDSEYDHKFYKDGREIKTVICRPKKYLFR